MVKEPPLSLTWWVQKNTVQEGREWDLSLQAGQVLT